MDQMMKFTGEADYTMPKEAVISKEEYGTIVDKDKKKKKKKNKEREKKDID